MSPVAHLDQAWAYLLARDYPRALNQCDSIQATGMNVPLARVYVAQIYQCMGKREAAVTEVEKVLASDGDTPAPILAMLGHAFGLAGHTRAAREALQQMKELASRCYVSSYDWAVLHTGLGENDVALRYLRQALKERSPRAIWLNVDPAFDSLVRIDVFRTSSAAWGWNSRGRFGGESGVPPARLRYKWRFSTRFRRHAFGWQSQPAIARVKEAVSEIQVVARHDQLLAAEGAVVLLERLSPALEHVDSSSGAIGSAVNRAVDALAEIVASAPADPKTRDRWLERLWEAYQADAIPYIEALGDYWGALCGSPEVSTRWADRLVGTCRLALDPDPNVHGYFHGTTVCLSALLAARRYQEILDVLAINPRTIWHYRQYGVKALAAMGRPADAVRYAEQGRGLGDSPIAIARMCEAVLLAAGQRDEAYRYALIANQASTYAAWFRAVLRKYPERKPTAVLDDLVAQTPGDEGKWFAAAKDAKLFDKAIALANLTPCSPQTLTRAARDFAETNPTFALEAGVTALRWLALGKGYEITALDVRNAYTFTMHAAARAGRAGDIRRVIREYVAQGTLSDFMTNALGPDLSGS